MVEEILYKIKKRISKWSSKQKKKRKTLSVLLKLKKKSQPLS